MKGKIFKAHDPLPDTDYHEWVLSDHSNAHRHGGPDWLEANCNNPDCTAVGLISTTAVTALLEEITGPVTVSIPKGLTS